MHVHSIFWAWVLFVAVFVHDGTQCYGQIAPEWAAELKKAMEQEDIIKFYGKIIDQHGEPVEGAIIIVHIGKVHLIPQGPLMVEVRSDANGNFQVPSEAGKSLKGIGLSVKSIQKEGYEDRYDLGQEGHRSAEFRKNSPQKHNPDKTNPVIFHMRKKGSATFLFKDTDLRLCTEVKDSGKPLGYDFIRNVRIDDINRLILNDEPLTCDLQVKATFNAGNSTWSVVLSPGTTNGGIIVSTQLLYEAPAIGYQQEYTFIPTDGRQVPALCVYLKSRDPAIYTRYEIESVSAKPDFFCLWGKSVTNPYGDRNLEQATDLPYAVIKLLTDGVEGAFRSGQRPSTPDLQQLLLPAQVRLEPEALAVSPGILTAFIRLPKEFPVSGITSATCDYAPAERMTLNKDKTEMIIKFRRKDIEAAVGQKGENLDTYFVVRGTWKGAAGTYPFQGSASIKKIVGGK